MAAANETRKQGTPVIGAAGEQVWKLALDLLAAVPPGKLLEVAAGGGFLAAHLAKIGFDVTGTDLVNQWQFPELPFVCADLDEPLPFDSDTFDAVVFVEGIGYTENINSILREFHRVLKPGGIMVITMPNVFSLQSRCKFLLNASYRWFPHPSYQGEDKLALSDTYREPIRVTTLVFNLQRHGFELERTKFGGGMALTALAPFGLMLQFALMIENTFRKKKRTPTMVNSFPALLHTNVGVLARSSKRG